jgi:membrane protease YdiL (CAAX protease family)
MLAFIFTWFFWGISLMDSEGLIKSPIPREIFGMIGAFGPSIIGLVFLIKYEGRNFKSIIKETFLIKGKWYWKLFAFLLMPAILGLSYIITRFIFGIQYQLEWFEAPLMIPIVYLYILFLGGPLGEEIGWRGYALKKMLRFLTPFSASLILGLIWTVWHVPAFFIEGSAQAGISFYLYTINTLVLTMFITILMIKTKFRIASALYFHASSNFALGIFYIIDESIALLMIGVFMISVLTFLLVKYRHLYFSNDTQEALIHD